MPILVCADEIGSVRALNPIVEQFCRIKTKCYLLKLNKNWSLREGRFLNVIDNFIDINEFQTFVSKNNINAYLFSVNVINPLPLKIARWSSICNIPTFHVLDYWNAYRSRMELDGMIAFDPTIYFVPDKVAAKGAIAEGVNADTIIVSGNPDFQNITNKYNNFDNKTVLELHDSLFDKPDNGGRQAITFISEPVKKDEETANLKARFKRGYDERSVLSILIESLKLSIIKTKVAIIPHPRENINQLKKLWSEVGGSEYGKIYNNEYARPWVFSSHGVLGMASTLLYEAWLIGKPVLSLQPGLKLDSLKRFALMNDVTTIFSQDRSTEKLLDWFKNISEYKKLNIRPEADDHKNASRLIVDTIINFK